MKKTKVSKIKDGGTFQTSLARNAATYRMDTKRPRFGTIGTEYICTSIRSGKTFIFLPSKTAYIK